MIGLHVEAASLFGGGDEQRLAMPHTTFEKVADYWKGWMDIAVMPVEGVSVEDAQDQVVAAMRGKRGLKPAQENNFAIVTQERMLETFNNITGAFFMVMLALSSVGLMVGGVGVVAIMMISVTERTREIGVRKALGATRREVLFQFLVEAATLTLVGGAVGLVLGGLIAWGIHTLHAHPGRGAALVGGRGAPRLDRDRHLLRDVSRQQGEQAGPGGGAAVRVGAGHARPFGPPAPLFSACPSAKPSAWPCSPS